MATDAASETSLLRPLAEDLRSGASRSSSAAGAEKIAAQHAAEKLTARERLALLIDEGTFVELGHPRPARTSPSARWTAARRPPTG